MDKNTVVYQHTNHCITVHLNAQSHTLINREDELKENQA